MVTEKNKIIKTADFEAEIKKLEQDIKEMEYPTKSATLRLVEAFKKSLVGYEPREEIEIPRFMEVKK